MKKNYSDSLVKSDIRVNHKQLRKAARAAMDAYSQKEGYKLASKLVRPLFTDQELAVSCGKGIRKIKGYIRPTLDSQRQVLRGLYQVRY
ncbi:hypothetical protein DPMN_179044 [Dreissena polymorpha]|uniref:Uncharacterized protein n=1 Tax=Dreissena polymorpha TaxID=45954 RepID=A0A9D4EFC7_DREPO|nr:hypothetical protein DPMN_179044 [Dreissena polymorpha]